MILDHAALIGSVDVLFFWGELNLKLSKKKGKVFSFEMFSHILKYHTSSLLQIIF